MESCGQLTFLAVPSCSVEQFSSFLSSVTNSRASVRSVCMDQKLQAGFSVSFSLLRSLSLSLLDRILLCSLNWPSACSPMLWSPNAEITVVYYYVSFLFLKRYIISNF